jgi:hypothetical protein
MLKSPLILIKKAIGLVCYGLLKEEPTMRTFATMYRALITLVKKIVGPRRSSGFACAECERWRRCGSPPSNNCIVMLEQIARDGSVSKRVDMIYYDAALI